MNDPHEMTDLSELDGLAMDTAAAGIEDDIAIETVEVSPDAAAMTDLDAAPTSRKAKKAAKKAEKKAKVAAEKTTEAPKKPKSTESIIESADPTENMITAKTKEPKEPKVSRPDRIAAAGTIGQDVYDLIAGATLPKKVAEKAENLLDAIAGRRNVSVYTNYAIKALQDSESGQVTSTGLVKLLEERGYSPGTARAQAQQMMALLPAVGVVAREKGVMTLIPASPVFKALTKAA